MPFLPIFIGLFCYTWPLWSDQLHQLQNIFIRNMKINWPKRLFITGIDTDAGKSYATGWLANLIMHDGEKVITQKFIQTGNQEYSEDIQVHRSIMGLEPQNVDVLHYTAPLIYSYPASPDLAARIDGTEVDLQVIDRATDILASQYSHVLTEGAGGLMVPLKEEYLTIDYINDRHLPVVLVTNAKLGSINHTLLSLNAIKDKHLNLFAVIFNHYFDKDRKIAEDTHSYIRRWLDNHFPDTLFLDMV